jgi:hypothetical protein
MKKNHLKAGKEGMRTLCGQSNYGGKKVVMTRITSLEEFIKLPPELQCRKCREASNHTR